MKFPAQGLKLRDAVGVWASTPANLQPLLAPYLRPTLPDGRYLHWDEFRRRPVPDGITHEQAWAAVKIARNTKVRVPGFVDQHGSAFAFVRVDAIDRALYEFEQAHLLPEFQSYIADPKLKQDANLGSWLKALMQAEALSSSLFEGARLSTREQGMEMLRSQRAPVNKGERMVMNNYRAMQHIVAVKDEPLTVDTLLELHRILGEGALDTARDDGAGRFRRADEHVVVSNMEGETWFTPPPASEVASRIEAMLAFANSAENAPGDFVHPLVAAITLHFWLAWIHPFVDGNGRLARALFYWRLLHAGYDIAEYISISSPLLDAPTEYYRAFAHTETDEGDLTYFILHQLGVLKKATESLRRELKERVANAEQLRATHKEYATLNARQVALHQQLAMAPNSYTTFAEHQATAGISLLTARSDLRGLVERGMLKQHRVGHEYRFVLV